MPISRTKSQNPLFYSSARGGWPSLGRTPPPANESSLLTQSITNSASAVKWRFYLASWDKIPELDKLSPTWIESYLTLRSFNAENIDPTLLRRLDYRLSHEPSGDRTLDFEKHKILAQAFFLLADYPAAKRHYMEALALSPPGSRDFLEICLKMTEDL